MGDELDLTLARGVNLPDAFLVGLLAHGGYVARVRMQDAVLARDDGDMSLLAVEDVLETREPEQVAVCPNDDRIENLVLEKPLYLFDSV